MPIINRIDMLSTGIRSEVGVKVFGADLAELERLAREIAEVLRTVPGAANVYPEPVSSGQYLNIRVDREAAARYGLTVADVEETIEYAIGETPAGRTIEGRERYPIRVRLAERFRQDADAVGRTPIVTAGGQQVPLSQVARNWAQTLGINVHLDVRRLEEAGVDPETPITCEHPAAPRRMQLERILGQIELHYFVRDDVLLITTREECEQRLDTYLYDVRQRYTLLAPPVASTTNRA